MRASRAAETQDRLVTLSEGRDINRGIEQDAGHASPFCVAYPSKNILDDYAALYEALGCRPGARATLPFGDDLVKRPIDSLRVGLGSEQLSRALDLGFIEGVALWSCRKVSHDRASPF